MKKVSLNLLLLVVLLVPVRVQADNLLSGEFSLQGKYQGDSPKLEVTLNLIIEKQGWDNGFHVDFDINSELDELDNIEITLQEAYYDHFGDNFDARVGKQVLSWGTAVNINPTDNLNPINLEDLFGPKQPVMMVSGNYYLKNNTRLTGVVIPYHQPVKEVITLPGGQTIRAQSVPAELANYEYALKYSARGVNGYDYSASIYRGFEDMPTVSMKTTPAGLIPAAYYREYLIYGGDIATSINGVGLWGEGAYFVPDGADNYYNLVLGADYKFASNLYLEGQLVIQKDQQNNEDFLVQGAIEDTFARIHTLRFGTIINPDTGGYLLMPEVELSLADATTLNVKYQYRKDKLFTNEMKNNLLAEDEAAISLKYSF